VPWYLISSSLMGHQNVDKMFPISRAKTLHKQDCLVTEHCVSRFLVSPYSKAIWNFCLMVVIVDWSLKYLHVMADMDWEQLWQSWKLN